MINFCLRFIFTWLNLSWYQHHFNDWLTKYNDYILTLLKPIPTRPGVKIFDLPSNNRRQRFVCVWYLHGKICNYISIIRVIISWVVHYPKLCVSSRIVANISEASLPLSQQLFRSHWRKILPENYYPIFRLILQNFTFPGYFPCMNFHGYPFSLLF